VASDFFTLTSGSSLSQRAHIAHFLREAIVSGKLKPGTQLKQNELSEKFQCSPGPVREAMRDLESEGLIEHFPNRGVFVTQITSEEFLEMLLPARVVLEKFALKDAAKRFTPEIIEILNELIEIMRKAAKKKDIDSVNEADMKFHTITMHTAATQQTFHLWKSVMSRVRLELYRVGPHPNLAEQASNHTQFLAAILSGDTKKLYKEIDWHCLGSVSDALARDFK
jgi:DNA-binding GntR family transcriptional regulator